MKKKNCKASKAICAQKGTDFKKCYRRENTLRDETNKQSSKEVFRVQAPSGSVLKKKKKKKNVLSCLK